MKQRRVSVHVDIQALLGAEIVAVAAVFALAAAGLGPRWAVLTGVLLGALACVVQIGDAVLWRWIVRAARRFAQRTPRKLAAARALAGTDEQLTLPDGATRSVPHRALAFAVRQVLAGRPVHGAYRRAGMIVPPPGAPVVAPVLAGEVVLGDIGQFSNRQIVALGEDTVVVDGRVVDMTEIDTSTREFLGWFHPTIPGTPINVYDADGNPVGVLTDGHTLVSMIAVWGRAYMPTVLHPQYAETPNLLPLTIIADNMQRVGLNVDVDVVVEGARHSADPYGVHYDKHVGARAAAGQRSTTLVIRLDTRDLDTVAGLVWRDNTGDAAVAGTRRIAFGLQQSGCRVKILEADDMWDASLAAVGGRRALTDAIDPGWKQLRQRGRGYLTSFYFSAADLRAEKLDEVWAYTADPTRPVTHTTLVVALRRRDTTVTASAMVRLLSTQPLASAPAPHLNRATGWQWDALQCTIAGARRLKGLPSVPVTGALDGAVVVGPSGVMLGGVGRDGLLLMPLSDPAGPTRIALCTNEDLVVRQLIRRAAAVGERVAVYDPDRRWAMSSASPYIWNTANPALAPPWSPTLVVHNGQSNPYPGAWSSIAVADRCAPTDDKTAKADIELDVDLKARQMLLRTRRFDVTLVPVTFRNEQTYIN